MPPTASERPSSRLRYEHVGGEREELTDRNEWSRQPRLRDRLNHPVSLSLSASARVAMCGSDDLP